MLIKIEPAKCSFSDDNELIDCEEQFVWFKGYFFIDYEFYNKKKAAVYLSNLSKEKKIDTEIEKCNGVFTAIIIHKTNSEAIIVNDRYGFGHLFYNESKDKLIISDNYWKLADIIGSPKIDEMAIYEILRFRYILRGHTILKNIQEIVPASIYRINYTKQIEIKNNEYWKFRYLPKDFSNQQAEQEINTTLNKILHRYCHMVFPESNVGINLTGGIDSRYLLGTLLNNGFPKDKITSFTFGAIDSEDIRIAAQIASVAGIKHSTHIFEEPFLSMFDTNTIQNRLSDIGFMCFYFQAYGISTLIPKYKDIDYLITGADGYFVGLMAKDELFGIKSRESLCNYIIQKNGTILNQTEIDKISEGRFNGFEKLLAQKINNSLEKYSDDYISAFYDWTIKNRLGKYILSIHELLNKEAQILYPFYDYDFLDLMGSLPFEQLKDQKAYVNAMFRYCFAGRSAFLTEAPLERKQIAKTNENYYLKLNKQNLMQKIRRKLFALPEYYYTYPMYKSYHEFKNEISLKIYETLNTESTRFNKNEILNIINKNSRNEHFFRYGLLAILNTVQLEKRLLQLKEGKEIENIKKHIS